LIVFDQPEGIEGHVRRGEDFHHAGDGQRRPWIDVCDARVRPAGEDHLHAQGVRVKQVTRITRLTGNLAQGVVA
jgi:hypothetical protein